MPPDLDLKPWDAAEFLSEPETQAEYLRLALEDPSADRLPQALGEVARARGMSAVADAAGLNRQSLYRGLADGSKPSWETVSRVIHALGLKLSITPQDPRREGSTMPNA